MVAKFELTTKSDRAIDYRRGPFFQSLWLQTFAIFAYFSAMQFTSWIPLRLWNFWGEIDFLDTWQVLYYADCYRSVGLDIYRTDGGNCSNYIYGRSLVQLLNFLNLDTSFSRLIGYVFLFLLAIAFSQIYRIESFRDLIVIGIILNSPPVLLLAERGNFDILIIFLISLIPYLVKKKNIVIPLFLITFTALMKYYTAPLLILFLFIKSKRVQVISFACIAITTWLIFQDIKITEFGYSYGPGSQFGFTIWGKYLNFFSSLQFSNIQNLTICVMIFLFIVAAYFLIRQYIPKNYDYLQKSDILNPLRIDASKYYLIIFVICYFAGMNYDYRLTYLALALLTHIKLSSKKESSTLLIFLSMVLWLTYPSGVLRPIGDLILEVGISILLVEFFKPQNRQLPFKDSKSLNKITP